MAQQQPQSPQVQSVPLENVEEMPEAPFTGKLQHLFEINNLGPGDKLVVVQQDGNLKNVYFMPDGKQIMIQDVTLKMVLGNSTKYDDWKAAEVVLDKAGRWEKYGALLGKVKKLLGKLLPK
jgi:hypothetical protein